MKRARLPGLRQAEYRVKEQAMTVEGWTRFKTQEAADSFRHEHYLFVYTAALELTGSPEEAHRLAAQVFDNVRNRFSDVPLSKNCDHFLAAQVNLLYAKGLQKSGRNPRRETHSRFGAGSVPATEPARAENISDEAAESYALPTEEPPASLNPLSQPSAESTFVVDSASGEGKNNPAVYITISVGTGMPAASSVPPAVAAPVEQEAVPRGTWAPSQTMSAAQPSGAFSTVTVAQPPVPVAPIQPVQPPTSVAEASAVQTNDRKMPYPSATRIEQTQPARPEPVQNIQTVRMEAAPPPPERVIYDPKDTEFWAPTADAVEKMVAEPPPDPELDMEGSEEKHSVFLTLLNGLLMLGVVGIIIYLLVRLNGTYKFF